MSYRPADHYDRVTAAWGLLLGDELHYGLFETGEEPLPEATQALTGAMTAALRPASGDRMLDVGCGTGAPACALARSVDVDVLGITTSPEGLDRAAARAAAHGLSERVRFKLADGMDNGLPAAAFDRVWVLEAAHLMRRRDALVQECARVLRPGGRIALCDITLRRPLDLAAVRTLRVPLTLLRSVFGDARMEPLHVLRALMQDAGLIVDVEDDLTAATRPTFARWRANADAHRDAVVDLLGQQGWQDFRDSCDVLEGFWDDGTLGYGLIAATRPASG